MSKSDDIIWHSIVECTRYKEGIVASLMGIMEDAQCCSGAQTRPDPLQLAGHFLRGWQQGFEQLVSTAQHAGAQLQLNAVQNLQHMADALANSPLNNRAPRITARPAMLCCLSSGPGGFNSASGPVRLPRTADLGGNLSASRDGGPGEQGSVAAPEGSEEPILISEVGWCRMQTTPSAP